MICVYLFKQDTVQYKILKLRFLGPNMNNIYSTIFYYYLYFKVCCCCSVLKLCWTLCDPMDCSMPGFPVLHNPPEFAQTHVH